LFRHHGRDRQGGKREAGVREILDHSQRRPEAGPTSVRATGAVAVRKRSLLAGAALLPTSTNFEHGDSLTHWLVPKKHSPL